MENVGIFYNHFAKIMVVWYSLWSFGIFFPFWSDWTKKSGNPDAFFGFHPIWSP
jgi:hypothetical protein